MSVKVFESTEVFSVPAETLDLSKSSWSRDRIHLLIATRISFDLRHGQHSLLVLHSFTNLVSLQPVLFMHWQEATAYKYDIYLLPTTGRKI